MLVQTPGRERTCQEISLGTRYRLPSSTSSPHLDLKGATCRRSTTCCFTRPTRIMWNRSPTARCRRWSNQNSIQRRWNTMPRPGRHVAAYARVSSERQAQQRTVESQVAAIQERVAQDGERLAAERCLVDDGYSGDTLGRHARATRSSGLLSSGFAIRWLPAKSIGSTSTHPIAFHAATLTRSSCSRSSSGRGWKSSS